MGRLSDGDRDLARIAQANRGDWALDRLLHLGDMEMASLSLRLGMIVGGRPVRGNLATSEELAAHIDDGLAAVLDAALKRQPEQKLIIEAFQKALRENSYGADVARRRKDMREIEEEIDKVPEEEWPAELEHRFLIDHGPRRFFTLKNAEIWSERGWLNVGLMRVRTHEVSAWWVFVDEEASI